jgi:hypothetical protein
MKVRVIRIHCRFFPQWKDWFKWKFFWKDAGIYDEEVKFDSKEKAIQFLKDYKEKHSKKSVVVNAFKI